MKTPDYLNSDRLSEPNNFRVYQETYQVMEILTDEIMEMLAHSHELSGRQLKDYKSVVFQMLEDAIVPTINNAIHKFRK
jgi:hypothetical protein